MPTPSESWDLENDRCIDPIRPRMAQDTRGYFMLPQAPMESGYYTYGLLYGQPDKGAYQYAHPIMMTAILRVGLEWQAIDNRRFGVGNISQYGGRKPSDHKTHRDGLQVDIRALRKDGHEAPVQWFEEEYDLAATTKLLELFRIFAPVKSVLFNDARVPFVRPFEGHDNHMHIDLRG